MVCLSLLLSACVDDKSNGYNINQLFPQIVPDTEAIEFGEVVVLYNSQQIFQLLNAGRAPLEVKLDIDGNEDGVFSLDPNESTISVNEAMNIGIEFAPLTYLEYERDLVIISNDPEQPEVRIPITGSGIDGPVPNISITPRFIDFGEVSQNATRTEYFQIQNTGTGTLEISDVQITGSEDFQVINGFANTSYGQGQSTTVIVEYTPTTEGGANATMLINSNDPDAEQLSVTLLGNGGGDFEYPIADFNCL